MLSRAMWPAGLAVALLAACTSAGAEPAPSPTATPVTVAPAGFIPGQVLAALPVYPGAVGAAVTPGGNERLYRPTGGSCAMPRCPWLQVASAQFFSEDDPVWVEDWYEEQLPALGYRRGSGGFGDGYAHREFYDPEQLLVNVEVYFYYYGRGTLFEVFATYLDPLPKPEGESIPLDADRVEITYNSGWREPEVVTKTVTDATTVQRLASTVNGLPVRPDVSYTCPMISNQESYPEATLRFASPEGESWTVRNIRGCPFRVEFEGYPDLQDVRGLLW